MDLKGSKDIFEIIQKANKRDRFRKIYIFEIIQMASNYN